MTALIDDAMRALIDRLSSSSELPSMISIDLGGRLSVDMCHHLVATLPKPRFAMIEGPDGMFALCSGVAGAPICAPATVHEVAATAPMVVTLPFDIDRAPAGTVLGYTPRMCLLQPREGPAVLMAHTDDRTAGMALLEAWCSATPTMSPSTPQRLHWQHSIDEQGHARRIDDLLEHIAQGVVSKVVSARRSVARAIVDDAAALRALHALEPTTTAFLVDDPHDPLSTWWGASPEWLCRRQGVRVEVDVLAGTTPRHDDLAADAAAIAALRASGKEQSEHAFVHTGIAADLDGLVVDIGVDRDVAIKQLRHVHHLHRRVHATLSAATAVFPHLHPTAAVAGTPRGAAMTLIHNTEGNRGLYAGAIGIQTTTTENMLVVLRCAHHHDDMITLHAGGGIVAGSVAALEWQELNHKIATLQEVFGRSG
jgi:isochorismate synthase